MGVGRVESSRAAECIWRHGWDIAEPGGFLAAPLLPSVGFSHYNYPAVMEQ